MVEVCHTLWCRDDACFAVPWRGTGETAVAAPPWATASISSTSPSLLRLGNKIGKPTDAECVGARAEFDHVPSPGCENSPLTPSGRVVRTVDEEARRRVTEERVRIARELHNVVAHHITLVNAQAGVAHHLMRANPEQAYAVLAHIKDNSRAALDELRATVGLLRQPDDAPGSRAPIPTLADLDALVSGFRASGMPVSVARVGDPSPVAPATELTAYRIIQEALTNTHKHASATRTAVVLDYGVHSLRITVTDDGRPGAPKGAGTGHGLIGMRERATAIGGTVTAGPQPEGGFQVVADLPLSLAPTTV
jgi:signal transduction histidine kinase